MKRYLNQRQSRQVHKRQQNARTRLMPDQKAAAEISARHDLGPEQLALCLASYGIKVEVELPDQKTYRCFLRQHIGPVVAGDHVVVRLAEEEGVVVACQPRRHILGRPDEKGQMKPIAANVDQVLIVTAPQPLINTYVIDSYLVMAELLQLTPVIVLNKKDLLGNLNAPGALPLEWHIYKNIGYPIISICAQTHTDLIELLPHLRNKTNVLLGQTGVGKSSIVKALLPDQDITIGRLSATVKGRHTTTTARFYHLPQGGALIDSPGVRAFSLWHMSPLKIAEGFKEFQPYLGTCQFRNCLHQEETECALQKAVSQGHIHRERFANYQRLCHEHHSPKKRRSI